MLPFHTNPKVVFWLRSSPNTCVLWTKSQDLMAVENIWVKWTHCYVQETSVFRSWVQCSGRLWCLLSVQVHVQRKYSHYPITPLKQPELVIWGGLYFIFSKFWSHCPNVETEIKTHQIQVVFYKPYIIQFCDSVGINHLSTAFWCMVWTKGDQPLSMSKRIGLLPCD